MPNQYSNGSHRVVRACDQCGSAFSARLSKVAAGGGRFCSRPCKDNSRRTAVQRICESCGSPFVAQASRVRAGLAKFCSPKCNGVQLRLDRTVPIMDRLWPKVDKTLTCWLWTGHVDGKGYGQIVREGHQGKPAQVHRVVYEALVGPIPDGLQLDHLCRVRRCCRPNHLEPVTQTENQRRGYGFSGVNARKTHCAQGHPFDEANTIVRKHGHRGCRICSQAAWRKYGAKRKARSA